jgi:hypothetical protein
MLTLSSLPTVPFRFSRWIINDLYVASNDLEEYFFS